MTHAVHYAKTTHGLRWLALLTLAGGIALFLLLSAAGAQDSIPDPPGPPREPETSIGPSFSAADAAGANQTEVVNNALAGADDATAAPNTVADPDGSDSPIIYDGVTSTANASNNAGSNSTGVVYDGVSSTATTGQGDGVVYDGTTSTTGTGSTTGSTTANTPAGNATALQNVLTAYNTGDFDAALAGWDDVELPQRTAEWASIGRAALYLRSGDLAEARAALNAAIQLDPQNAVAHYYLGLVYLNALVDDGFDLGLGGSGNLRGGRNATPYFTDSRYSATPYFTNRSYSATPYFVDVGTSTAALANVSTPVGSTITSDSSVATSGFGTTTRGTIVANSTSNDAGTTTASLGTTTATGAGTINVGPNGTTTGTGSLGTTGGLGTTTGTGSTTAGLDARTTLILQAAALEFQRAITLAPGLDENEFLLDVDPDTINAGGVSPTVGDLLEALQIANFQSIALKLLAVISFDQGSYAQAFQTLMLGMLQSDQAFDDFDLVGASLGAMDQRWAASLAYFLAARNDLSGSNLGANFDASLSNGGSAMSEAAAAFFGF